jgi:hypothetical protein
MSSIAVPVQTLLKELDVVGRHYRDAFRLPDSPGLQDPTHQDFSKMKAFFLRMMQSFLDTINRS